MKETCWNSLKFVIPLCPILIFVFLSMFISINFKPANANFIKIFDKYHFYQIVTDKVIFLFICILKFKIKGKKINFKN